MHRAWWCMCDAALMLLGCQFVSSTAGAVLILDTQQKPHTRLHITTACLAACIDDGVQWFALTYADEQYMCECAGVSVNKWQYTVALHVLLVMSVMRRTLLSASRRAICVCVCVCLCNGLQRTTITHVGVIAWPQYWHYWIEVIHFSYISWFAELQM